MSFDAPKLMLTGLARFDLPGHVIRLCDGGFVYFEGEKYTSSDEYFGSIEAVREIEEMAGDEAPGSALTFLPASTAAAATLSSPSYQSSRVRFWLARVDEATGEIDGTPELLADMLLDTTALRVSRGQRALDMELIAAAERLFLINDGNVLSPRFHKSIWPGETGLDNATGVPLTVAWGVESPPRGTVAGGGAGGYSGGAGSALDGFAFQ